MFFNHNLSLSFSVYEIHGKAILDSDIAGNLFSALLQSKFKLEILTFYNLSLEYFFFKKNDDQSIIVSSFND